jgi:hypothetical protein
MNIIPDNDSILKNASDKSDEPRGSLAMNCLTVSYQRS